MTELIKKITRENPSKTVDGVASMYTSMLNEALELARCGRMPLSVDLYVSYEASEPTVKDVKPDDDKEPLSDESVPNITNDPLSHYIVNACGRKAKIMPTSENPITGEKIAAAVIKWARIKDEIRNRDGTLSTEGAVDGLNRLTKEELQCVAAWAWYQFNK